MTLSILILQRKKMRKICCVFGVSLALCYGGISSGSSLSEDTLLNHTHQLIGFQSKGNALGWLEITKEAKAPITLKVAPLHLHIIQPIWSIDKDSQTSLSAFGIANFSSYEVNFDTKSHAISFPSIATMTSSSYSSGIFQSPSSTLNTWGNLIFGGISHQGARGSSFGVLGGKMGVRWGEVVFDSIHSEYKDAYGVSAELEIDKGSKLSFGKISAGGNAYGVEGRVVNKGELRFEEIKGGDQNLGFSGNAVGIKGVIENSGEVEFSLISAKNGGSAYGVRGEVANQGRMRFGKIASNEGSAFGIFGSVSGGGSVEFGEIGGGSSSGGGNAYGIYNLLKAEMTNNASFSIISSIQDNQGRGGRSYGIYNLGDLQIEGSEIVVSSLWGSEVYPIFSQGELKIYDSSLVFGGKREEAIISFESGEIVLYRANLVAKSGGGIVGSGSVRVLGGGEMFIDTPQNAFGGEIDVVLEEGATLRFGSDSQMKSLRAKHSIVTISSKSATLDIYDFNANHSSFILASSSQTSDRIFIHSTSSTTTLTNNLYIKLDEIPTTPNYVLLVHLPKELGEQIIFNELFESSSKAGTISYMGFDELEVPINRHDTEESVYYYADLNTPSPQINSSFLLPTQTALNANHSLFLLHLNSLGTRTRELRDSEGSGLWGRADVGRGSERMQGESEILFSSYQGGYDYGFCTFGGCDYVGIFASYLQGNTTQEGGIYMGQNLLFDLSSYDVLTQGFEAGIYNAYVREGGVFSNSIFKVSGLYSNVKMPYQDTPHSLSTYALSLSQEIGYQFLIGRGAFLDLQVGVGGSYLTPESFAQKLEIENNTYTLTSSQKELWILRSRAGGRVGYKWSGEEIVWALSVGGFYEFHAFYGGEIEYISANAKAKSNPYVNNQQGVVNAGFELGFKESSRLYVEFERSFGGKLVRDFSLNFGARFSFGASQVGRAKVEQS